MFGVVFPEKSFPMDASAFSQIDPLHWVLNLTPFAGESYHEVKQMCIFLLAPNTLPSDKALAVYVQAPGQQFVFCGAVHVGRPSAVLSLPWPDPAADSEPPNPSTLPVALPDAGPKIGVSVEDLAMLPSVADAGAQQRVEKLAMRVGENLFNFMQSFCGVDGSKLVVPMDILDRWFKKFQERTKKDPTYLQNFFL